MRTKGLIRALVGTEKIIGEEVVHENTLACLFYHAKGAALLFILRGLVQGLVLHILRGPVRVHPQGASPLFCIAPLS